MGEKSKSATYGEQNPTGQSPARPLGVPLGGLRSSAAWLGGLELSCLLAACTETPFWSHAALPCAFGFSALWVFPAFGCPLP